jgi:hypothetical protein
MQSVFIQVLFAVWNMELEAVRQMGNRSGKNPHPQALAGLIDARIKMVAGRKSN